MKNTCKRLIRNSWLIIVASIGLATAHGQALPPTDTNGPSPYINVQAWGYNDVLPNDLTNVIKIAAGYYRHNLALRADSTIKAWGDNYNHECDVPNGLSNVVDIAAGYIHSVALKSDGTVVAWGYNYDGACTPPADLTNAIAIGATDWSTVALKSDGTVVAWGKNSDGECDVPSNITNAIALDVGEDHVLVIRADHTVAAWGNNSFDKSIVPSNLTNAVKIACGGHVSLVIKDDGTLTAWGLNAAADFLLCNIPPDLTNNVIGVAGGYLFNVAIRSDGTIEAWGGENRFGELNTPQLKATATSVSASHLQGFAVLDITRPFPPIITQSPHTQTAGSGTSVQLGVDVKSFPPLTYQWYFGTNAVDGGTNASLTLTNLASVQSGEYHVVVSNSAGSTTSSNATLSVVPVLGIRMVPAISINGAGVGNTYTLQYINVIGPTDAWTNLADIVITNDLQYYFDLTAEGQPTRFYRLMQ